MLYFVKLIQQRSRDRLGRCMIAAAMDNAVPDRTQTRSGEPWQMTEHLIDRADMILRFDPILRSSTRSSD